MVYYDIKCKYTFSEELDERTQKRIWEDISTGFRNDKTLYKMFVYKYDETVFYAVLAFSVKENSLSSIKKSVIDEINKNHTCINDVSFSGALEEITVEKAISLTVMGLKTGCNRSYGRASRRYAAELC